MDRDKTLYAAVKVLEDLTGTLAMTALPASLLAPATVGRALVEMVRDTEFMQNMENLRASHEGRAAGKKTVTKKVAVVCSNASGDRDIYQSIVHGPQECFDEGEHYDAVKEQARDEGYGGPWAPFDEDDRAGQLIFAFMDWTDVGSMFIGYSAGGE